MKTIEEKAKAYDEAIKRAKKIHSGILNSEIIGFPGQIEYIFPQLRESDDERTRRRLIEFISDIKRISESGRNSWAVRKDDAEMCNAFLSYLEKQKEQKPAWSEEDKKLIDDVINSLCCYQNTLSDYQKEIVGEEIRKLKSLKPQPKQEWSEEDEKIRNLAIEWAETMYGQFRFVDMGSTDFRKIVAWLKSIRPSWKPSEEQIKALESCFREFGEGCPDEDGLRSLYNDLKKL